VYFVGVRNVMNANARFEQYKVYYIYTLRLLHAPSAAAFHLHTISVVLLSNCPTFQSILASWIRTSVQTLQQLVLAPDKVTSVHWNNDAKHKHTVGKIQG
jgi:hypothetical protein